MVLFGVRSVTTPCEPLKNLGMVLWTARRGGATRYSWTAAMHSVSSTGSGCPDERIEMLGEPGRTFADVIRVGRNPMSLKHLYP